MKRSYPYTGPGSAAAGPHTTAAPANTYPPSQPAPPAGPAPPLPAGPAPSAGQAQAYANYGYGQAAAARSAANSANTSVNGGTGLTPSDAQQAQWHQQWQQYYAQQAAVAAPGNGATPPQQNQMPAPQQSPGYVPGRTGPSAQTHHTQSYGMYPTQQPQQGAYQYPTQQPSALGTSPGFGFQPSQANHHQQQQQQQQASLPQVQSMHTASAGFYGANQSGPPAKRTRYDQHQAGPSIYPNGGGIQNHQGPQLYGSGPALGLGPAGGGGHLAGMQVAPNVLSGPSQNFGWQGSGALAGSGPRNSIVPQMSPAAIGAAAATAVQGAGRGSGSMRGHGVGIGSFPGPGGNGLGHVTSPINQSGSPAGAPPFRGAGGGAGSGSPAIASTPERGLTGWGARGGRAGGGPATQSQPSRPSVNATPLSNRRGGTSGADRGGRSTGGSTRNVAGPRGRNGFSSQNSIPINAPHGPASSRAGRDASKPHTARAGSHASSTNSAGKIANVGHESRRANAPPSRGTAVGSEPAQGSNSRRSLTSEFKVSGIQIDAIGWSWPVSEGLLDGGEDDAAVEKGEDADADDLAEANAVAKAQTADLREDADAAGDVTSEEWLGDAGDRAITKSGDADVPPSSASLTKASPPGQATETRPGSRLRSTKSSLAQSRAANATPARDSTKLQIRFGAPLNAGPDGAPTGPKADKDKLALASAGSGKRQQERANMPAVSDAGGSPGKASEVAGTKSEEMAATGAAVERSIVDSLSGNDPVAAGSESVVADQRDTAGTKGDSDAADEFKGSSEAADTRTKTVTDIDDGVGERPQANQERPGKALEWTPFTKGPPPSSVNRVTISYADSRRRLVIDADSVKSLMIHRAARRIEIVVRVVTSSTQPQPGRRLTEWAICKGVLLESRGQGQTSYMALSRQQLELLWRRGTSKQIPATDPAAASKLSDQGCEASSTHPGDLSAESTRGGGIEAAEKKPGAEDAADEAATTANDLGSHQEIPPLYRLLPTHAGPIDDQNHPASTVEEFTVVAHLDQSPSRHEPSWVKTGDIDSFLCQLISNGQTLQDQEWRSKIHVVDPVPPPTIDSLLQEWCSESFLGSAKERRRYLKSTYLSVYDEDGANAARDEANEATNRDRNYGLVEIMSRIVKIERGPPTALGTLTGPLAASFNNSPWNGHNHASLSFLAMFDLVARYAQAAHVSSEEVRQGLGEMLVQWPRSTLFKTLDSLWKEQIERVRSTAGVSAGQKRKRDRDGAKKVSSSDQIPTTAPTPNVLPEGTELKASTAQALPPVKQESGPEKLDGESAAQPSSPHPTDGSVKVKAEAEAEGSNECDQNQGHQGQAE